MLSVVSLFPCWEASSAAASSHLQIILNGVPHHDTPLEQHRHLALDRIEGCGITQVGRPHTCSRGEGEMML